MRTATIASSPTRSRSAPGSKRMGVGPKSPGGRSSIHAASTSSTRRLLCPSDPLTSQAPLAIDPSELERVRRLRSPSGRHLGLRLVAVHLDRVKEESVADPAIRVLLVERLAA